jgi:site-specific recombinase XerD
VAFSNGAGGARSRRSSGESDTSALGRVHPCLPQRDQRAALGFQIADTVRSGRSWTPTKRSCYLFTFRVHIRARLALHHSGFARMLERAGEAAKLGFKAHPRMLRHACGFALANKGHYTRALQAYLGHRNIQHTVRYTELAPDRFKDFWR